MSSLFVNSRANWWLYLQSVTENSGFPLRFCCVSERRGRGGGGGGDGHWVQSQVQGWSFIWWWRALLLSVQLLSQLGVQFLHGLAALWSHKVSVHTTQTLTFAESVLSHVYAGSA